MCLQFPSHAGDQLGADATKTRRERIPRLVISPAPPTPGVPHPSRTLRRVGAEMSARQTAHYHVGGIAPTPSSSDENFQPPKVVILSGVTASQSEAVAESKDPYRTNPQSKHQARCPRACPEPVEVFAPETGWPIQAVFWLEWGSSTVGQSVSTARSRFPGECARLVISPAQPTPGVPHPSRTLRRVGAEMSARWNAHLLCRWPPARK